MQNSVSSSDLVLSLNYSPGCVCKDMTCRLEPWFKSSSTRSLLWPWNNSEPNAEGTSQLFLCWLLCVLFAFSHHCSLLGLYRALDLSCSEGVGASLSPRSPMLVTVNVTGQGLQHNELSVFWTPPPHQVLRQHCSFQGPVCIGLWEGFLATSAPVSSTAFPELETTCCWEDVRKGQG